MRFELGLSALPGISLAEAKTRLAGFPKGVNSGVIIKAMEERRIPSVAVAFSENRAVINEIEDRLVAMGAECYVVDHAFFLLRFVTYVSERARRSRYRGSEEDRSLIRLGSSGEKTPMSDLTRRAAVFLFQLAVVEGLFIWRVSLDMGVRAAMVAPWFVIQLSLCAGGLVAAYALTRTARAYRAKRIDLAHALPPMVVAVFCTVMALLFFNAGHEVEAAQRAVHRPPSKPFAGLMVELRKRKLAGLSPSDSPAELAEAWDALGDEVGDLQCLNRTGFDLSLRACLAGRPWDLAHACMPMPQPTGLPPLKIVRRAAPKGSAPVAATRAAVVRPWTVSLELVHVVELTFLWLLSLACLFFFGMRSRERKSLQLAPQQPTAVAVAPESEAAPAPVHALQQLQQRLHETQTALLAHQHAVAQFRQQLGPARQQHDAQVAEIARLRQQMAMLARTSVAQAREPVPSAQQPANSQGTLRRPAETAPAEDTGGRGSSYSVSGGHEERMGKPKRRV